METAQKPASEPEWSAAEKRVGKLLTSLLADGYLVLLDVKFKYGNLDAVVIRPDRTVFLIEVKSHRGTVATDIHQLLLNGRPFQKNYLCQVNRGIRWLRHMSKRLFGFNPWIVAVIVFPNADVRITKAVKRVNVLNSKDLLSFIRSYRR